MDKPKQDAAPVNPFVGLGGCVYINPKGSNTFYRDRNEVVPFHALTEKEKFIRVSADRASGRMSEKDFNDRVAQINVSADDLAEVANTPLAAPPVAEAASEPGGKLAPKATSASHASKGNK